MLFSFYTFRDGHKINKKAIQRTCAAIIGLQNAYGNCVCAFGSTCVCMRLSACFVHKRKPALLIGHVYSYADGMRSDVPILDSSSSMQLTIYKTFICKEISTKRTS